MAAVFKNPVIRWIDHRLPVFSYLQHEANDYPTPKNLSYWWNFGSIAGFMLMVMIATGIFLAMQYTPHVDHAFNSVERIMRDVNYGWMLRYIHMNGASMFFIAVYIHIFRGIYYGSFKAPRELLWMIGVVILLLMMATAFMGYVLPWGQMSFWGATVITNLFSALPVVGGKVVTLLWGGFSVDNPTLNRFFSLHYLLPFVILGVVVVHVIALHRFGSNNPTGIDMKGPQDQIPFHPYYTVKDMYGLGVFMLFYAFWVFFAPVALGDPVLLAVLRDPALDPGQAHRRARHGRLDRGAVHPALAGPLAGPLRRLPPGLQALLLDPGFRLRDPDVRGQVRPGQLLAAVRIHDRRAGIHRPCRGPGIGRCALADHLRRRPFRHPDHLPGPDRDRLLLRLLPGDPAAALDFRAHAAAAAVDQQGGAGKPRWRCEGKGLNHEKAFHPSQRHGPGDRCGRRPVHRRRAA
jgi:hypothetical protein